MCLNTRAKGKNGQYPVYCRIVHRRKAHQITMGLPPMSVAQFLQANFAAMETSIVTLIEHCGLNMFLFATKVQLAGFQHGIDVSAFVDIILQGGNIRIAIKNEVQQ